MANNLFIIIPVFNRKEFTRMCLESLRAQSYQAFEVVVVDDGSTDGTAEMLATDFPEVHVQRGDGNLWWTGGVNMGIRYALTQDADVCLTLNNDTMVPPDYLSQMALHAANNPETVFGSLEKDIETDECLYGGEFFDERKTTYLLDVLTEEERKGLHPVTCLPGRGLWIPKIVFDKNGLFDQKRFPHYFADYDFTYNAYKAGFPVMMNYDAWLYAYPDESGKAKIVRNKSLKGYYDHLFSMRGGANLKDFTNFTVKNSPGRYLLPRLLEGYARRLLGYWLR